MPANPDPLAVRVNLHCFHCGKKVFGPGVGALPLTVLEYDGIYTRLLCNDCFREHGEEIVTALVQWNTQMLVERASNMEGVRV